MVGDGLQAIVVHYFFMHYHNTVVAFLTWEQHLYINCKSLLYCPVLLLFSLCSQLTHMMSSHIKLLMVTNAQVTWQLPIRSTVCTPSLYASLIVLPSLAFTFTFHNLYINAFLQMIHPKQLMVHSSFISMWDTRVSKQKQCHTKWFFKASVWLYFHQWVLASAWKDTSTIEVSSFWVAGVSLRYGFIGTQCSV